MKKLILFYFLFLLFSAGGKKSSNTTFKESLPNDVMAAEQKIFPGNLWYDTDGNPINAHGGGILYENETYYWFGEYKKGDTWLPESNSDWGGTRVEATGIACYSSRDLYNWKNEGIVLKANKNDSTHDLHTSKVMERPKVIFNNKTNSYVMWFHCDSQDYAYARAGVAVSDHVTGPYNFIRSLRPNNAMSRDQTLFKDTDGKAYHIYSSEENMTMHISLLTDDYLEHVGNPKRIFIDRQREAPSVFKRKDKYYIISSGCTGWDPNPAEYAVADDIMGDWKVMGDPCIDDHKGTTFDSQSTFVFQVQGKPDSYILMGDRWNKNDLEQSRYVWLPVAFDKESIKIQWLSEWAI